MKMRSPTAALIWEQWRQVRLPVCFGFLLTVLASWWLHFIRTTIHISKSDWIGFSTGMAGLMLTLVMAVLLFAHSSPRDLRMGLPARMLILPVSIQCIAVLQIGFRLAVVGLFSLSLGLSLTLIDRDYADSVSSLVGASLLCYSYASAVASTIGKRSPVAGFVTIVLTIMPVLATVAATQDRFSPNSGDRFFVFCAFAALCIAVSFVGIASTRNALSIAKLLSAGSLSLAMGKSPAAANTRAPFAFESRRIRWMFPCFTAALISTLGISIIIENLGRVRYERIGEGLLASFLYGPPIIAMLVGMLLIAREHRDSVTGMARFTWTRPASVQQVVLQRMRSIALSMILTFAAVGLIAAVAMGSLQDRIFFDLNQALYVAFFAVLYIALLLLSWCIVWAPYVPIAYWVIFALYTSTAGTGFDWGRDEDFWLIYAPELLFLTALTILARASWRRRIFQRRVAMSFIVLSALVFAAAFVSFQELERLDPNDELRGLKPLSVAFILSLVPLFALLSQGVYLDRVRHGALFRKLPPRDS